MGDWTPESVIKELEELAEQAERLSQQPIDAENFERWHLRSAESLREIMGEDSAYYRRFASIDWRPRGSGIVQRVSEVRPFVEDVKRKTYRQGLKIARGIMLEGAERIRRQGLPVSEPSNRSKGRHRGEDEELREYDIALSFAGEQRDYVRRVADCLKDKEVTVFFDEYEEVNLWGKNLVDHLSEVYSQRARYCVVFVSEAYKEKIWPTTERRSAQERALRSADQEYILPVRFDDTEIPGLLSTVHYIDANQRGPEEVCDLILEKLNGVQ